MLQNTAYIMAMNERRRQTLLAAYRQIHGVGCGDDGSANPGTAADFQDAVKNLKDNGTIRLAADIEASEKLEFKVNAKLDLAGKKLVLAGTDGGNEWGAVVSDGKTLTVENGTVEAPARGFLASGGNLVLKNVKASGFKKRVAAAYGSEDESGKRLGATLMIDKDCEFTTSDSNDQIIGVYGFDVPGSDDNLEVRADIYGRIVNSSQTVTVSPVSTYGSDVFSSQKIVLHDGAVIECASPDCPAVYFPARGEFILEGGLVKGSTGIYTKGGKIVVPENSTAVVEATQAQHVEPTFEGSGSTNTGEALTIDNCHTGSKYGEDLVYFQPDSHEIKGGTFKSAAGKAVGSYATHASNLTQRTAFSKFISGGEFSQKVDDAYLADGFECVEDDGVFRVRKFS